MLIKLEPAGLPTIVYVTWISEKGQNKTGTKFKPTNMEVGMEVGMEFESN